MPGTVHPAHRAQLTVTTGTQVEGKSIVIELGIVRGIVVRAPNIAQNIFGAFRLIFGGNIVTYEGICEKARQQAFDRMVAHARDLQADAIIGMRYDATEFMAGVTEILAYGTAVKLG